MSKIKVLIIDDSELIRRLLTEIISSAPDLEVVACAVDPIDARDKIKKFNPDVLTLDIEMPKMDGITFLRNLMRLRPMPVVMISSLTARGAPATLDALEIGAVDYIAKPKAGSGSELEDYAEIIQEKLRHAARANVLSRDDYRATSVNQDKSIVSNDTQNKLKYLPNKVICIGSSTGGIEAIREILFDMPLNCPPILIAQHIPAKFSTSLAARLNRDCAISVKEAKTDMVLDIGNAYLAPGEFHLNVIQKNGLLVTRLDDGEKVNGHKPSVDVLFESVLACAGTNTVAVILTGMGYDGAKGIKSIFDNQGVTFAQDEATSVVWGMPSAAIKLGAIQHVLPINKIKHGLLQACEK